MEDYEDDLERLAAAGLCGGRRSSAVGKTKKKPLFWRKKCSSRACSFFLTRVLQFPNARCTIYKNDILSIVDPARQLLNSIWPDDTDTHRCVDISISVVFPLWPSAFELRAQLGAWEIISEMPEYILAIIYYQISEVIVRNTFCDDWAWELHSSQMILF